MDEMVALDIESCTLCPQLILPGDEVYVVDGELAHVDHRVSDRALVA